MKFGSVILASSLALISAVYAAPVPLESQIEILRINGVDERDIEHALNPNHVRASAYETTYQEHISSHIQHLLHPSHNHGVSSTDPSSEEEFTFTSTIDGYSTAKIPGSKASPASASLGNLAVSVPVGSGSQGAFERVREWMSRRAKEAGDEGMVVTGRMGEIKVRGR